MRLRDMSHGVCRVIFDHRGISVVAAPAWVILLACLPAWLTGCATSADPHDGGFVSGVVGLAGGGYQRRIAEREGLYQSELDAQERLKASARALEQERATVRGDLERARIRVASQERRIARERAQLVELVDARQGSAATQQRLRQLDDAQAKASQAKVELSAVRAEDQSVTDLKAKTRDINKELDQIDGMVGVVSGSRF